MSRHRERAKSGGKKSLQRATRLQLSLTVITAFLIPAAVIYSSYLIHEGKKVSPEKVVSNFLEGLSLKDMGIIRELSDATFFRSNHNLIQELFDDADFNFGSALAQIKTHTVKHGESTRIEVIEGAYPYTKKDSGLTTIYFFNDDSFMLYFDLQFVDDRWIIVGGNLEVLLKNDEVSYKQKDLHDDFQ
jgi:hypothetical protein